jgi:formiminotetrahydrofolate cyclodeaminase
MSNMIPDMTISGFLGALGSHTPSPGGGAVAALSGASGASLLLMAAEFSGWTDGSPDPRPRLKELSARILALAQEDAEVYAAYSAARTSKESDPAGYARAVEAIAETPAKFCETAVEALELVPVIIRHAPKWFACDIAIAASGLEACADGGRLLSGINVASLKEPAKSRMAERLAAVEAKLEKVRRTNSPLLMRALPGK